MCSEQHQIVLQILLQLSNIIKKTQEEKESLVYLYFLVPHSFFLLPVSFLHFYLFIWLCWVLVVTLGIFSCSTWDLVPWPGIKPRSPASEAQSPSHWITREGPQLKGNLVSGRDVPYAGWRGPNWVLLDQPSFPTLAPPCWTPLSQSHPPLLLAWS